MPHLHIRPRGMLGFMFYSATMILAGLVKTETRRGALLPCGLCATSFSATHLRVRHANTMRRTQAADALRTAAKRMGPVVFHTICSVCTSQLYTSEVCVVNRFALHTCPSRPSILPLWLAGSAAGI